MTDLDVEWPAQELVDTTIIDTPGTSSLSTDVSARTLRLLVPEDGVPRVDAVVFLLRTLNAADIALLKQIGEVVGGSAGALGVVGVASRADEIGAGRIDAMMSAKDVAKRFTTEMEKTGICQAVVPVSGLLALTARTLRQSEFVALEKLSGVEPTDLAKSMLSVDRFVREDSPLPLDVATRAQLLDRFGMFGLRISIASLRSGIERLRRVGRRVAGAQRTGRAAGCHRRSVRAAVGSAEGAHRTARAAAVRPGQSDPGTPYIVADIDPLIADTHAFEELRLLSQLRSRKTTFNEDEMVSLRRIIGGSGADPASRLGLEPETTADGPRAAFAQRSAGGVVPITPSTTRSPREPAGRRYVAPKRSSRNTHREVTIRITAVRKAHGRAEPRSRLRMTAGMRRRHC